MDAIPSSTDSSSRKVEFLYRQVSNILSALAEVERDERGLLTKKKDLINALAVTFEHLHKEGAYTEPVNTICSHICKLAREKGLLASERWIREVIEAKYKQTEYAPRYDAPKPEWITQTSVVGSNEPPQEAEQQQSQEQLEEAWRYTVENSISTPEMSSESTDPYLVKRVSLKPIDEMTPEELRIATEQELRESKQLKDVSREKSKRAELMLERCDELKIAIDPEVRGGEDIPVESALSEDSGPSEFSEALKEYSGIIKRAADKVEKYRPPPHLDKKFAKAVNEMILVWRPWVDEKFRKDTFSWLHVAMDEAAHGKHAAATIHSTILPDGTKRALTREQVGDKKEMVNQQAMRILACWKDWVAMHRWNFELEEKAVAFRAKRLHKRLSNSA
jgi:hypothetical protein